ncbi:uncharacterized protein [Penaeus vannamei]|uniref:uncharacterized protein n=1 Tax=Penaeus vannamei TaxID=6689 RepID=UPI00387F9783
MGAHFPEEMGGWAASVWASEGSETREDAHKSVATGGQGQGQSGVLATEETPQGRAMGAHFPEEMGGWAASVWASEGSETREDAHDQEQEQGQGHSGVLATEETPQGRAMGAHFPEEMGGWAASVWASEGSETREDAHKSVATGVGQEQEQGQGHSGVLATEETPQGRAMGAHFPEEMGGWAASVWASEGSETREDAHKSVATGGQGQGHSGVLATEETPQGRAMGAHFPEEMGGWAASVWASEGSETREDAHESVATGEQGQGHSGVLATEETPQGRAMGAHFPEEMGGWAASVWASEGSETREDAHDQEQEQGQGHSGVLATEETPQGRAMGAHFPEEMGGWAASVWASEGSETREDAHKSVATGVGAKNKNKDKDTAGFTATEETPQGERQGAHFPEEMGGWAASAWPSEGSETREDAHKSVATGVGAKNKNKDKDTGVLATEGDMREAMGAHFPEEMGGWAASVWASEGSETREDAHKSVATGVGVKDLLQCFTDRSSESNRLITEGLGTALEVRSPLSQDRPSEET